MNNFSTFPTLAIGILVAALRNASYDVQLISPLAHDVPAAERERAETYLGQIARRVHLSTFPSIRAVRNTTRDLRRWKIEHCDTT